MAIKITSLTALVFAACVNVQIGAFAPTTSSSTTALFGSIREQNHRLYGYIAADSTEDVADDRAGGVGFSLDNAIVISGNVDKKGNAVAREMKHYSKISSLDISSMSDDVQVIGTGEGIELYEDPGLSTTKSIMLAPIDAVEGMLDNLNKPDDGSMEGKKILINFAGGDELMVHEVLDGVQKAVAGIDITAKNKDIEFRSISDAKFPIDKCGVAAVALSKSSTPEGNVFYIEGEWYTVSEEDVVTYDE